MTRALGLDVGDRRVGLAVADDVTRAVHALGSIVRRDAERDAATISRIARDQSIDRVVVGLPLNMDGTEGVQSRAVREWVEAIATELGLPVVWQDERLTTRAAEARIGAVPRVRGSSVSQAARRRHRHLVDRESARLILEAYLAEQHPA